MIQGSFKLHLLSQQKGNMYSTYKSRKSMLKGNFQKGKVMTLA